jgi:thiamine-phosphate pyrophosphorylase
LTRPAFRVPRLTLVTDRHATAGRPLAAVVEEALRGVAGTGLAPRQVAVQLREKDLAGRALLELARALRETTEAAGVELYVNDRIDVALAVGADGVHLGGESLGPAEARALAPALAIGVSAHGIDDLRGAGQAGVADLADLSDLSDLSDFYFLGPIYDTPAKRRYGPPLGLGALATAAEVGLPLIAIGGIEPANLDEIMAAGAKGVACIRAVMAARDPSAVVRAFCRALSRFEYE